MLNVARACFYFVRTKYQTFASRAINFLDGFLKIEVFFEAFKKSKASPLSNSIELIERLD